MTRGPIWLILLCALNAGGQGPDSIHAGGADPHLPQPESKADALSGSTQFTTQDSLQVKQRQFTTPGVPNAAEKYTTYKGEYFSIRFGFAALIDYDAFGQDADSRSQVGAQRDQWDDRSLRFMLSGDIGPKSHRMHYFASYSFNGFDAPENKKKTWDFTDLIVTFPAGKLGAITFGKNKEAFCYEMVGDAPYLPPLERILNPFFTSRNVGVSLSNTVFGKRMTYSGGWYNDWWITGQNFDGSSNHFASRITGLISANEEGSRYLHAGVSGRYTGAVNGTVQLKGRAGSNVTSYYVDTGKIAATDQKELALETLWTRDGYSVLSEYIRSWVNATKMANPSFYGFYITGSWMITGEHRPYDRNVGFARRPIPEHRWGAVELIAQYSHVDLDDKSVHGGLMDKGVLGMNWYLNRYWRIGINGGVVNLNRSNVNGLTSIVQARLQFIN